MSEKMPGAQGTPDEILEAEKMMTPEQKKSSDRRDNYLKYFEANPGVLKEKAMEDFARFETSNVILWKGNAPFEGVDSSFDENLVEVKHFDNSNDVYEDNHEFVVFRFDSDKKRGLIRLSDEMSNGSPKMQGKGSYDDCMKWLQDNGFVEKANE